MKNLGRIWKHLRHYTGSVFGYLLCAILTAAFGAASIGMLAPVLNVLFRGEKIGTLAANAGSFDRLVYNFKAALLEGGDPVRTLLAICVTIVIAIVLKNVFYYLGLVILMPVRNGIIRKLRSEMFAKVLSMPISYFTEERKGDLVSRMTNDINEVKDSVLSVMEVFIREPITILVYLGLLIAISPQLSLFLLFFLPVAGLVIGRIGSSLRRSARTMAEQMADITIVLDETLGGMRVVKAFGAEKSQKARFEALNEANYLMRIKTARRQELASPLSEALGVIMVAAILYVGGRLVLRNESALSPESFLAYIAFFSQIISPIKTI